MHAAPEAAMVANEILQTILSWANRVLPEPGEPASPDLPRFIKPRSILVVPSKFIGDNVLLIPFLRNLRHNVGPSTRIDLVTTPVLYSLYETLPSLDHVYLEKRHKPANPRLFLEAQGYDTIFFARYSLYWGTAARQARLSQRVGFDLERLGIHGLKHWGRCLTHPIPSTSLFDRQPQVELYLDMLRMLGFNVSNSHLECPFLPEADHVRAKDLLRSVLEGRPKGTPGILIQAASGSPGKQWPAENWHQLLRLLHEWLDPVFIVTGSHREQSTYEEWEQEFPLLNLCGQTSLRETLAVMQQVDLVITLDTSTAHLAALAEVPRLVVLYGPTNQAQWRPQVLPETAFRQVFLDLPCRPCPARTCEHRNCLRQLGVANVMAAIQDCYREKPAFSSPLRDF
jgi:heptosyltransferase-2